MKNAESKENSLKGHVTAKLQANGLPTSEFNAEFLYASWLGSAADEALQLLAYQGDLENEFTAIYLVIPKAAEDAKEHKIEIGNGEGGIRAAFINYSGAGYAKEGGLLRNFQWSLDKKSVSFRFGFSAETELRTYHIDQGDLNVTLIGPDVLRTSASIDSVMAKLESRAATRSI